MISYGKQTIDQSDIDAVIAVLKSDWLTQGPVTELFEKGLTKKFGPGFCSLVSNGTAALHLTGLALGWTKGDVILTSPLSFVATSNSIVFCGANPDFCDIDEDTYTIDPEKVEQKVSSYIKKGIKIKALIGVDYAGHPCDWSSLRTLSEKYDFQLVNDNCHALGAKYKNKENYALDYADVTTHSYHPVKPITSGEGGAVLTKDKELDAAIRLLRSHGISRDHDVEKSKEDTWYYEMSRLGFNYRMSDIQAALGLNQLKRLDYFIKMRKKIAAVYNDNLSKIGGLKIPSISEEASHSYHLYPVLIDFFELGIKKEVFFKKMLQEGIRLQVHYIPIHLQTYYRKTFGFNQGDFPITESFYEQEVSLPIYPTLKDQEIEKVITSVRKVLGENT